MILVVVALVGAELFARYYLGLGEPPLSVADPELEYIYKPSQEVRRFGNRVYFNAYSMRSPEFGPKRTDPHELRVMVIGDSTINGGTHTDQSQLATTLLQEWLAARLDRPVIVGNISTGSWGPPNMLAYVNRYGLFDADLVVLVLNSADYRDYPDFAPKVGVDPTLPDRKPLLALQELIARYVWPRLRAELGKAGIIGYVDSWAYRPPEPFEIEGSLNAVRELIDASRRSGAQVIAAQFLVRHELLGEPDPGFVEIQSLLRDAGVEVVQLSPAFREAMQRGEVLFRDIDHPNVRGQKLIADQLFEPILRRLEAIPATRPVGPAAGAGPATSPVDRVPAGG